MVKLKAILIVLLVAILLFGIVSIRTTPAIAQARYGTLLSAAAQTNTALILPADTWVYGIKIYADEANSFMGIYNAATIVACTNATVRDEIGEATQYDTAERRYVKPVYFADGVSVIITTGVAWVEYGPEP